MRARAGILLFAGLLCALLTPAARAQAPDTSLTGYMSALADSTAHFFRGDSLGFDSTGTDSLAALYTRHPELGPRGQREYDPRRGGSENGPVVRANRVEGMVAGARLQLNGIERGPGALSGMAAWSFGLHRSSYALGWSRGFGRRRSSFTLHLSAYRSTQYQDVLEVEPDPGLELQRLTDEVGELRFRREGYRARAAWWGHTLSGEVAFRDEQAHSLDYPGRLGDFLINGTPAGRLADPRTGRVVRAAAGAGIQPSDGLLRLSVEHAGFDGALSYTRILARAGRTLRLGNAGLLGAEAAWGSADSGAPAQAQFFGGGQAALAGYPEGSLQGRQIYLGRLTALFGPDILGRARIPHPALLDLSLALFAETGASPALQPADGLGPRVPSGGDWASDVGVGLWLRPGLPDPESYVKLSAAVPVGPHNDHRVRVTASWSRILNWF